MTMVESELDRERHKILNELNPGPYHDDDVRALLIVVYEAVRALQRGGNIVGTSYMADALTWTLRPFRRVK